MNDNDLKRNASGCLDPTAYKAITNIDGEQKKCKELVRTLLYICNLAGFEVQGRIVLKHKKSGRIWE